MGLGMRAVSAAADRLEGTDALFTRLLEPYFAELDRLLRDDELVRFSTLFARFSEKDPKSLEAVAQGTLLSMTHVFVDEFQDISPDVVGWIRGVLGALKRRGVQTSLLCVGDDYQSIYGWRGSSPHYFLRYEAEFPSEAITRVKLEENFRSGQTIIDSAERTLLGIPRTAKTEKHGRSRVKEPGSVVSPADGRCRRHRRGSARAHRAVPARQAPQYLRHWAGRIEPTNEVAAELDKLTRGTGARPTVMTFHKSKGLEADICVLVGDCLYLGESPFRNLAYSLAASRAPTTRRSGTRRSGWRTSPSPGRGGTASGSPSRRREARSSCSSRRGSRRWASAQGSGRRSTWAIHPVTTASRGGSGRRAQDLEHVLVEL